MRTQKIAGYKIVSHEDVSELETIVNAYLEEGYELYGSPFCTTARYCQAIVRHNESSVDGTSRSNQTSK
jgi:hypothetical protein